jgi:ferrous iron transport protein B
MTKIKFALIGNPNSGKSTIFNNLTGLRQKTSNFPGVTVEKKVGEAKFGNREFELIDLPGTYSLFPNSKDEKVVGNILCNNQNESYPDAVIYVADVNQIERHLLLTTQIHDLGFPMIIILNMMDILEEKGNSIDSKPISELFDCPVITMNARTEKGFADLKKAIENLKIGKRDIKPIYTFNTSENKTANQVSEYFKIDNPYQAKLIAHHHNWLDFIKAADAIQVKSFIGENKFEDVRLQIDETMTRYGKLYPIIQNTFKPSKISDQKRTLSFDSILTNRIFGPLIFFSIMFIVFQSIFSWAETPMTWIEDGMSALGNYARTYMADAWYTDLLVDGIIAGLGGVLVFIPQILLLFFFLALLEESGYMSRVVFMFDNIMQKVGLNGRSMVALISSGACAVPAIMSTRTIGNWKERLITIMVSPLIPCSARIPVYTVLIALIIPSHTKWGIFNKQGIAFMGLYILGILMSLVVAFLFKLFIKSEERSYLMIELPQYKKPLWSNIFIDVSQKVWSFIESAGKTIMVISIILWFLASFGPGDSMQQAREEVMSSINISDDQKEAKAASAELEASYAGRAGKLIEPAIKPIGFDWKIGIALITSFAAREVFVGTMATIYNLGDNNEETSVREVMATELRQGTNMPMYDARTSLSLIIFYAFAMQCMSTLAITKKETGSWKWAIIQFVFYTVLAYFGSWLVYNFL